MIELDDIDAMAAEYVLGTLSREERIAVQERRAQEPKLDRAIADWERRLGPLSEVIAPVAPSPNLYSKIRAQIGLSQHVVALRAREEALKRRISRWRGAALGMTAMAASLAAVVGWQRIHPAPDMPTKYVAVLQTGKQTPPFLLMVDTKTDTFVISAINAPRPPGKDLEVWLVHDEMPKPKSLGCFKDGQMDVRSMSDGKDHDMFMNATFAVSLEPEGGSPTGAPTGPILFSGKLFKATPGLRA